MRGTIGLLIAAMLCISGAGRFPGGL